MYYTNMRPFKEPGWCLIKGEVERGHTYLTHNDDCAYVFARINIAFPHNNRASGSLEPPESACLRINDAIIQECYIPLISIVINALHR